MAPPWSARKPFQKEVNPNGLSVSMMDDLVAEDAKCISVYFGPDGILARGIPGFHSRNEQSRLAQKIWRALQKNRKLLAEAGTGLGKCVRAGTLITLADGSQEPIENLCADPSEHRVAQLGPDLRVRTGAVLDCYPSGRKETFRVRTRSGREISASADHRFLTVTGWKQLSELSAGAFVATPRVFREIAGLGTLDRRLVVLVALILADGGLTCGTVNYTKQDPALVSAFQESVSYFADQGVVAQSRGRNRYDAAKESCKGLPRKSPVITFFESMGLMGKGSAKKFIPSQILSLPTRDLAVFLGALWSGDGCISSGRLKVVSYSSASKCLIHQVQHLLLRFGILSKVRRHDGTCGGKSFENYTLEVTGGEMLLAFGQHIGPHLIGAKAEKLAKLPICPKPNPNVDLVPSDAWGLVDLHRTTAGVSHYRLRNEASVSSDRTRSLSRRALSSIGAVLGSPELVQLAHSDIFWDEIRSIESEGEHETFDITMADEPNFIANDIIVHNSIAGLIPAIEYAMQRQCMVVISTHSKVLQGQYASKDLPLLERVLESHLVAKYGRNFRWTVRKGGGNYLCLSKLSANREAMGRPFFTRMQEFDVRTSDGDLEQLALTKEQLRLVTAGVGYCPGQNECKWGGRCYPFRVKNSRPDILVVNHHLLAAALVQPGLISDYGAVLIDEAHKWEDTVREALQVEVTLRILEQMAIRMTRVLVVPKAWAEASAGLFQQLELLYDGKKREVLGLFGLVIPQELKAAQSALVSVGNKLTAALYEAEKDIYDPLRAHAAADCLSRLNKLLGIVTGMDDDGETVSWLSQENGRLVLTAAPVLVGQFLREKLWRKVPSVLASATLCTKPGDFTFIKGQLDMPPGTLDFTAASPFDWAGRCRYLFGTAPEDAVQPRPRETREAWVERWTLACWEDIRWTLVVTQGKGFVLCTSQDVAARLYARHLAEPQTSGFPAVLQGQRPKEELVAWFVSQPHGVLYATGGFWEGVDVPELRAVAVDRMPFASPEDVVESAKKRLVEAEVGSGRAAFYAYSVPKATYSLKQAVGRLLRNERGRGLVLLLDPRLVSKNYGPDILQCLPGRAHPGPRPTERELEFFLAGLERNCRPAQGPVEERADSLLRKSTDYPGSPAGADVLRAQLVKHGVLSPGQWAEAVRMSPGLRCG